MTATLHAVSRHRAEAADLAAVREVFAETRDDLLVQPADTRELIVDLHFRASRRRIRLEFPTAQYELVVADGIVAGALVVAEQAGCVHVAELVVRAHLRRQGIGSAVLDEIVADADATRRGVRVRLGGPNVPARRWCGRFGFVPAVSDGGEPEMFRPPAQVA